MPCDHHASLGYRPPAPEVFVPALPAWPSARPQTASTAYAPAGAETAAKLTLQLDHSMGTDQGPHLDQGMGTTISKCTVAIATAAL